MAEVVVVSQMSMFDAAPTAESVVPETQRRQVPTLDEDWAYYDRSDRVTVAEYSATTPNPRWEWCKAGIWVSVERYFGSRPQSWTAHVYMELPDDDRTSWKAYAVCKTQDDAAREAADMVLAARGMLDAFLRGESVETPGQRRQRASEAHVAALPEVIAAFAKVNVERVVRDEIDPDNPEKYVAHRRYLAAKDVAEAVRRDAEFAFHQAHGWRAFVEVPHVAR